MSSIKLVVKRESGVKYSLDDVRIHHIPRVGEKVLVGSLLGLGDDVGLEVESVLHPVVVNSAYIHVPIVVLKLHWTEHKIAAEIEKQWTRSGPSKELIERLDSLDERDFLIE